MKERYIKLLKDFYQQHNRSPKRREFSNYTSQFNKVFGNWNKALEAANLPLRRENGPSKEKLIQSILNFYHKHSSSPRAEDCLKKNGLYDTKTYLRHLKKDTWAKVLEIAGLPPYIEKSEDFDLNEKAMLLKIKSFITENNIGSYYEYSQKKGGLPSGQYLTDRYGSWNNFIKKAGLEVNRFKYTKEFFIDSVMSFITANGYPPGLSELAEHLCISTRVITSYVGKYNDFINSQGLPPQFASPENIVETKAQLRDLYIEFSKKHGYENGAPGRALNASSDIYNADVFVTRFGSLNELRLACEYKVVKRGNKKYTSEKIKMMLLKQYILFGKNLTNEEINNTKTLPSITTILRYFKKTSMEAVWDEILKKENQN